MNYHSFLNKSKMFKDISFYRLKNKKKNSQTFLFFSVLSAALLTLLLTLLDSEKTIVQALEQTTKITLQQSSEIIRILPPDNPSVSPLDLPEIDSHSKASSQSLTHIETDAVDTDIIETFKIIKSEPVVKTGTIQQLVPVVTKASITPLIIETTDVSTQDNKAPVKKATSSITATIAPTIAQKKAEKTKTVVVKKGDTLSAIFKRLSLSANTLHQIINSSKQAKQLIRIKPGQKFIIAFNENNEFKSLQYDLNRVDTLIINKENDNAKFITRTESKEISIKQQFATATITNSLFAAGNKAGLSSAMIMRLAQLFGWDIDFALDIRKGDSFAVLFEEKYINDKKIANGNILSAEFINRGEVFKAIRYTDTSGHTDYYSEKGLSMRKAFLRTPVEFSRISSRFSTSRKHPVLNRIRAHKGVDYAAARGTAIKSVGDGKVIFKGRKGGYGRVIILQHGSKYTTLYAHMKSYNSKIKRGSRVKQGQVIGYIGSSGLATGPHLHYEFRINGVHRNPLTVPLPSASPIAKKYRSDFLIAADTMISQLTSRKMKAIALTEQ